jgi:hypothetical protein
MEHQKILDNKRRRLPWSSTQEVPVKKTNIAPKADTIEKVHVKRVGAKIARASHIGKYGVIHDPSTTSDFLHNPSRTSDYLKETRSDHE